MDCTTTATTMFNINTNSLSNASNEANEMSTSHDEVDFVPVATTTTTTNIINNNHILNNKLTNNSISSENATSSCSELNAHSNLTSNIFGTTKTHTNEHLQYQQQQQQAQQKSVTKSKKKYGTTNSNNINNNNNNNTNDEPKKKSSAKDRLSLFSTLGRRISQKALGHKDPNKSGSNCSATTMELAQAAVTEKTPTTTTTPTTNATQQHAATITPPPPRQRTFVKSSSIARLLGNTYQHHMKKFEKHQQLQQQQQQQQQQLSMEKSKPNNLDGKFHTFSGRRRPNGPYLNRLKQYSKDDGDVNANCKDDADGATDVAATMDFSEILEMEANAAEELQRASSGLERFCDYSTVAAGEDEAAAELGSKTMRTLSRSLGRLWGKRLHSVEISTPDPEYKVSYLGNVLTGWAKGEGCVEKQLNTLWRNYTQNNKPDMIMRIKVCASGLKATTRQHGLTEYWANRITHCCAPKNYPRIFCWVYRHEGRKMKHELRCHAVLCSKEKVVQDICNTLKENLKRALREFKREKILKQNARLSLANAAYENPSLPQRKILLFVGGNNYRPPLERSKSAPKLMAIEEAIGEEEGEDAEETNEPEMKPCCQKDSLYPAMTLGRRRCRRGHSIRRTGKARPLCSMSLDESKQRKQNATDICCHNQLTTKDYNKKHLALKSCHESAVEEEQPNSYGSDESDDFEKLLKYNDYDANTSLATELLPYFDMQLHKNTSSSLSDLCELTHDEEEEEPLSLPPTINTNPMAHPEGDVLPNAGTERNGAAGADDETHVSLRRDGVCSDGEEDFLDADDMYFRQATILNILHRNSMRKMAQFSLSSDEGSSSIDTNAATPLQYRHQTQSSISSNASSNATTSSSMNDGHMGLAPGKRHSGGDSDGGSISSGCETASTVTANQDDLSLQYRHDNKQLLQLQEQQQASLFDIDHAGRFFNNMPANDEHATAGVTVDEIYQRLEERLQRRQNSDATTFSSSSTITLKMGTGSEGSLPDSPNDVVQTAPTIEDATNGVSATRVRRQRQRQLSASTATAPPREHNADDTDSECSDESGYVEYREEREKTVREKVCDVERREQAQQQQQQQENEQHPIAHQRNAQKPQLPPKPMPRRTLSGGSRGTIVFSDQRSSNSTAV